MSPGRRVAGAGEPASGAADVVPLDQRVNAMMVFRAVEATLLTVVAAWAAGADAARTTGVAALGYLLVTGLASLGVRWLPRAAGLRVFGISLLVDGVFLQVQHEQLGRGLSIDVAIAAHLVAVCLLASFRTGLKIAIWQSVLLLFALRAHGSGLLPPEPAGFATSEASLVAELSLLWLVVTTTSSAAAINERELRRRRYDAEALKRFATGLHQVEQPEAVMAAALDFVVTELQATRALVVRTAPAGLEAVVGHGLSTEGVPAAPSGPAGSGLLALASTREGPTLVLRLDPARDPWLAAQLPDARRLVAVPLGGRSGEGRSGEGGSGEGGSGEGRSQEGSWLVFEHGARAGTRVESRLVGSAAQAAATATLAVSRAVLLQRAERAASTDGLTGVANRRTFDAAMQAREQVWARHGRPTALVMVDVDHFKSVNDRYGHQAGDEVLQILGGILAASARTSDLPARYGGEEFALVLPETSASEAYAIADRLRLALHDVHEPVRITASFGVAAFGDDGTDVRSLILAADSALIHAKNTGRDRVVLAASVPGHAMPADLPH